MHTWRVASVVETFVRSLCGKSSVCPPISSPLACIAWICAHVMWPLVPTVLLLM